MSLVNDRLVSVASFSKNGANSLLVTFGEPLVRKKPPLLAASFTAVDVVPVVIVASIELETTEPGVPKAPSFGFDTPVVHTEDVMSAQVIEAKDMKAIMMINLKEIFRIRDNPKN